MGDGWGVRVGRWGRELREAEWGQEAKEEVLGGLCLRLSTDCCEVWFFRRV